MAFEQKPNFGAFFVNKVKTNPKAPDYQGDLTIDMSTVVVENGVAKIKIAGWKKTAPSGLVYLSLTVDTFKPDPNKNQQPPSRQSAASVEAMDDDIPF
jgi:hypothetical protein